MTAILVGMSAGIDAVEVCDLAASAGAHAAFLQLHDPALVDVLTVVADAGASEIVLIGTGWAPPTPARSWIRRVAAQWLQHRSGAGRGAVPTVRVAAQVLSEPSRGELVRLIGAGGRTVSAGSDGSAAPLRSSAWENVPRHRHQVLVCRGPRCSAQGAAQVAAALNAELRARALGDDDVLVTVTGCQYPCNHAPVVTVQPDDVWYGGVIPDDVAGLVAQHLISGNRYADRELRRERSQPLE